MRATNNNMRDSLQMFGSMAAVIGAVLIATKWNPYIGFWHFLASSLCLSIWAYKRWMLWLLAMQVAFTVINIIGIWNWRAS